MKVIKRVGRFKAECECMQCGAGYIVNIYDARKSSIGHLCSKCKTTISTMTKLTQEGLKRVFDYSPSTGELTHKHTTVSGTQGEPATYSHSRGYLSVSIGKKQHLAHRVIFLMMSGIQPFNVDHVNHIKHDNRWENLRAVTQDSNNRNMPKQTNSTTGVVGVSFHKLRGKYRAYISVNSRAKHLGMFDSVEAAKAAREKASILYGYHVNHGK